MVKCPLFIVHGKKDEVVNFKKSELLIKHCGSEFKYLVSPDEMSHNSFDIKKDLLNPLNLFINHCEKFFINEKKKCKSPKFKLMQDLKDKD